MIAKVVQFHNVIKDVVNRVIEKAGIPETGYVFTLISAVALNPHGSVPVVPQVDSSRL